MNLSPGFFGALLSGAGTWELRLYDSCVAFARQGQELARIALDDITQVFVRHGVIWAELDIAGSVQGMVCAGLTNARAEHVAEALRLDVATALAAAMARQQPLIRRLIASLTLLLNRRSYLAQRNIVLWQDALTGQDRHDAALLLQLAANPLLPRAAMDAQLWRDIDDLSDLFSGACLQIKERNERFVAGETNRYKAFFDKVEKTPLSHEQRVACVVMEDCNLLVAAAGSGKTSTVVGKIGYALLSGQCRPADVLVLAFNNTAAKELDERINEQLRSLLHGGEKIRARTFHALGLDIIATAEGKKPSIANAAAGNGATDASLLEQLMGQQLSLDQPFALDWATFLASCPKAAKTPCSFKTLADWHEYVRANGAERHGQRGFLTMNGEIVKSQGELAIANWLYMQGIEYEYERAYEHDTASVQYRQYRPDFYLSAIDVYLEHYALDQHGKPPAIFGARYSDAMRWKAQLHQEHATRLITTTFADFVSGALFPNLEVELVQRGQRFSPRPLAEILERLNAFQFSSHGALWRTFLKHAKSNEVDADTLYARAAASLHPHRANLFVRLFVKLKAAYDAMLGRQGEIDFEDMIIKAAHAVAEQRYRHRYKMILVDEFQDISQARGKLLKALLAQAPECKLFAVGDDWQSIYRFAGADIALFTHFPQYFGVTATNYLSQTFRSNQGISDVAARFISRNPAQMAKRVAAQDPTFEGVLVVRRHDDAQGLLDECQACLTEIAALKLIPGGRSTVFILARYRHQKPAAVEEWQHQFKTALDIQFMTIHSAKGLQADHVMVLGMHAGRYAFPSEISDDPLLQLVMPQAESFSNAEERRLLYVALTRARHAVHLFGASDAPSAFLTELTGDDAIAAMLRHVRTVPVAALPGKSSAAPQLQGCPRCGNGQLLARQSAYGAFMGCSNYPRCKYTRNGEKAVSR